MLHDKDNHYNVINPSYTTDTHQHAFVEFSTACFLNCSC